MNTQTAYEQLQFINDVIKDRRDKNQATFFSVRLERFGKQTPLVDKANGETFYETIIQYLTRYDVSLINIELYHGKAHNIKEPFQTFQIPIKKNAEANLGYAEPIKKDDVLVTPAENVITVEKHFSNIIDKERQILFLDFEVKKLQSENEDLKKKNKKRKEYIAQLETELENVEKTKKQSLGNVSLGMVGSNMLENFAKSNFGIGLLKNVFGASEETLSGLLGTTEISKQNEVPEQKSTATIISKPKPITTEQQTPQTEEEKIRQTILKEFVLFFEGLDNDTLRLYFEVVKAIGKDQVKLQQVYMAIKYSNESNKNSNNTKTEDKQGAVFNTQSKENSTNVSSTLNEDDENPDITDTS